MLTSLLLRRRLFFCDADFVHKLTIFACHRAYRGDGAMHTPWNSFTGLEHLELEKLDRSEYRIITALPSLVCLVVHSKPYPTFSLFKALKPKLQYCRVGHAHRRDDYPLSYDTIYKNSCSICPHGRDGTNR